ncbi:hypothetical protein NEMBOFW57_004717 [Staphylotrichum longicolle]|uniref:Uncharacterized protein n=1 Tax=Staphylotrichum longicolle TaxID=669026 RepID=A0AAD4F866_9PEZI|nr:hypothetical protein NEMBOFW57_004717 [Staphylotrichum longicolle]
MDSPDSTTEGTKLAPSAQNNPDSTSPVPLAKENLNPFIPLPKDVMRLHWTLTDPFPTAIHVMPTPFYDPPTPLEPYILPGPTASSPEQLHPISQKPLTNPGVASVTVSVHALDRWEANWLDMHDREWEDMDEDWDVDARTARFGTLPGVEAEYDVPGREHLLMCCGVARPLGKAVTLTVEAANEGGVVTIGDFVEAVHPLMVLYPMPGDLMVVEEEEWKRDMRKHPLDAQLAALNC